MWNTDFLQKFLSLKRPLLLPRFFVQLTHALLARQWLLPHYQNYLLTLLLFEEFPILLPENIPETDDSLRHIMPLLFLNLYLMLLLPLQHYQPRTLLRPLHTFEKPALLVYHHLLLQVLEIVSIVHRLEQVP